MLYAADVDDMALTLNPDDKKWIKEQFKGLDDRITKSTADQVRDAVEALKPRGWRKAVSLARELGPLAATGSVFIAMLGITFGALYQSFAHVKEETEFRTRTTERLGSISSQLWALRVSQAASNPGSQKNQNEAKLVIAEAKQALIPIPKPVIEQAGKEFITAAEKEPKAWDVALQFVAYRSILNSSALSHSQPTDRKDFDTDWGFEMPMDSPSVIAGRQELNVSFYPPAVPTDRAAAIQPIGESPRGKTGPRYMLFEGTNKAAPITLDGFHVRNVVFRNLIVTYRGGASQLENVLFINCSFRIAHDIQGFQLARTILDSTFTTFQSGG